MFKKKKDDDDFRIVGNYVPLPDPPPEVKKVKGVADIQKMLLKMEDLTGGIFNE